MGGARSEGKEGEGIREGKNNQEEDRRKNKEDGGGIERQRKDARKGRG